MSDRLSIIATDSNTPTPKKPIATKATKRATAKAKLDRLWLNNPGQFDPIVDAIGRERVKRSYNLIAQHLKKNDTIADLGTGTGYFALKLAEQQCQVHAVELATTPVKNLENHNNQHIKVFQDYIPQTTLDSDAYDIVLGLDLIAYLEKPEYRLFFAELARLVKLDGIVIVSTPIDIYSEDALQNFVELVETEFNIEDHSLSYNNYFIRLCHFFEAPAIFVKASSDQVFYEKELAKRFSINQQLFKANCSKIGSFFWSFVKLFTNPLLKFIKQSSFIMLKLETICRFISNETGISHVIFVGKKRKLFENVEENKAPIERKGKQMVWE